MSKGRFKNEIEREVLLIAYDYCVLGLRGEKLAKHRHLSTATLARRIRRAKEEGYIQEAVLNIPQEELEEIYPYLYRANLMETVHNYIGRENLRNLIVIPSTEEKKQDNYLTNKERVGRAAAVRLLSLFNEKNMEIIGISSGRTLAVMVNELQDRIELTKEWKKNPKWVPIFGDLLLTPEHHRLYPEASKCDASTLASRLALATQGEMTSQLHLPAPAYIPQAFMEGVDEKYIEERISIARKFVEAIPAYQMIFGTSQDGMERDANALVSQMDTMITGIGGLEDEHITGWMGIIKDPAYETPIGPIHAGPIYNDEERKQLDEEGVVGHLCGTFITEDKVDRFPPDSLITQVNRRILGTKPSDFRQCADRARKEDNAGVIIVANGASKARAVSSAISNRCVTELICDSDLAEELAKIKGIKIPK